jgi:hypothetical protein
MSEGNINNLMEILSEWAKTLDPDADPPFADAKEMYSTIDACRLGHITWESFKVTYDGDVKEDDAPWKQTAYDVWFRDPKELLKAQLGNRDFVDQMDFAPKQVVNRETGARCYQDFMSGEWAWRQAVSLSDYNLFPSSNDYRTSLLRIPPTMGQHSAPLFLGATRLPFRWQRAKTTTIPCTCRMA